MAGKASLERWYMSRAKKSDKFFLYADPKRGHFKGKRLLGVNHAHDTNSPVTLLDLISFLNEHGIPPQQVKIPGNFITIAEE